MPDYLQNAGECAMEKIRCNLDNQLRPDAPTKDAIYYQTCDSYGANNIRPRQKQKQTFNLQYLGDVRPVQRKTDSVNHVPRNVDITLSARLSTCS